ncbi:hypothetical protein PYCC9005_003839 [Savitreella phatthalungensis]
MRPSQLVTTAITLAAIQGVQAAPATNQNQKAIVLAQPPADAVTNGLAAYKRSVAEASASAAANRPYSKANATQSSSFPLNTAPTPATSTQDADPEVSDEDDSDLEQPPRTAGGGGSGVRSESIGVQAVVKVFDELLAWLVAAAFGRGREDSVASLSTSSSHQDLYSDPQPKPALNDTVAARRALVRRANTALTAANLAAQLMAAAHDGEDYYGGGGVAGAASSAAGVLAASSGFPTATGKAGVAPPTPKPTLHSASASKDNATAIHSEDTGRNETALPTSKGSTAASAIESLLGSTDGGEQDTQTTTTKNPSSFPLPAITTPASVGSHDDGTAVSSSTSTYDDLGGGGWVGSLTNSQPGAASSNPATTKQQGALIDLSADLSFANLLKLLAPLLPYLQQLLAVLSGVGGVGDSGGDMTAATTTATPTTGCYLALHNC